MAEQRRIGYQWNLRALMAQRNLWKSTELIPLLRSRGINLSESQVYRLVTTTPERIPARTFAALCDILDCTPNDLFEPFVEMRSAATANAPERPEHLGIKPGDPIARRVRLIPDERTTAMTRPRRREDPARWPDACGRCGGHYQVVANWPDARVCGYCYQAAKRTHGTCACGHIGVLPGRVHGSPACRTCSGVRLNLDCRGCGAESELHSGDRCWACVLGVTVDQLMTDPNTGQIPDPLIPVAGALKTMNRANSGLTWINQPHVTAFLTELVTSGTITHTSLDALPATEPANTSAACWSSTEPCHAATNGESGSTAWAAAALLRLPAGEHRDTIRQFIRWHIQRRMTITDQISEGTYLRSKQTVTVAIDFLNWLTTERDTSLAEPHPGRPRPLAGQRAHALASSPADSSPGPNAPIGFHPTCACSPTAEEPATGCHRASRLTPSTWSPTPTSSPPETGSQRSSCSSSDSRSRTSPASPGNP